MKFLPLLFLLSGCATVVQYPNGHLAMATWSNMKDVKLENGAFKFSAATINNSTPTRAVGSLVSEAASVLSPGNGLVPAAVLTTHAATNAFAKPGDL